MVGARRLSMSLHRLTLICFLGVLVACGPTAGDTYMTCNGVQVDTSSDTANCGKCGNACASGVACNGGTCGGTANCDPGATQSCYDGAAGTEGVGPCKGGTQTCQSSHTWGNCTGEVVPVPEVCGDGIDNNCNGMVDE